MAALPAPGADVSNVTCHKTGPMSPPLSSEPEKHVSGQQVLSVSVGPVSCHMEESEQTNKHHTRVTTTFNFHTGVIYIVSGESM